MDSSFDCKGPGRPFGEVTSHKGLRKEKEPVMKGCGRTNIPDSRCSDNSISPNFSSSNFIFQIKFSFSANPALQQDR
jgi:hypothetical protein